MAAPSRRLLPALAVAVLFAVLTPAAAADDPVIAAAGDIACDPVSAFFNDGFGTATLCRQKYTSDLLVDAGLTAVLPLGDTQYENGAYRKFLRSYDPTWGRVKAISHPVIGNHEYFTGATGYYLYFRSKAGPIGRFWYSYDVGAWHLIALNGNCRYVGGCGFGSAQEAWLRRDLAAHPASCVLAYWHQPRFSSGLTGSDTRYGAFWIDLYTARADVVLNAHDHDYERFAPQNPDGQADLFGIREFVVGTGGKSLSGFPAVEANSEVRSSDTYGVLRLTLHADGYDWLFVPEAGAAFSDSGSASCT